MVETTRITTPIKIYGANYITRRCAFTGEVQNQAALYDNSAQTQATFYNADPSQRISWQMAFKDKYGQTVSREIDTVIIEGCTADSVQISYLNTDGETVSAGVFELQENNILKIPAFTAQEITFSFASSKNYFYVGEIRCLKYLFDLKATTETAIVPNTDGGEYTAQDGSFYSWTDYHRPGLEIRVENGNYAQYKALRSLVQDNESVTLIPFKELDFWVLEGIISRDMNPDVNRFSGLVDYTLEVTSK